MLWLSAGGECQVCGVALPGGWHADHVTPWRVTRRTNVFDMQALCPACNLKKGAGMDLQQKAGVARQFCDELDRYSSIMRTPQKKNIRLLREIIDGLAGGGKPPLASPGYPVKEFVPGGGKSFVAVMDLSVMVGSGFFDAGIWISPRTNLIEQAREDFSSISLGRKHFGRDVSIFNPARLVPLELKAPSQLIKPETRNTQVWLLSYQMLNGSSEMAQTLLQLAEAKNILIVFDEFQLLRDVASRGNEAYGPDGWFRHLDAITTACHDRTGYGGIILSGGLFRNDNYRLPRVNYRVGDSRCGEDPKKWYPVADLTYTLSEAQADHSIIKIDFDFYEGEVTFATEDDDAELEKIGSLTDKMYDKKLKQFLDHPEVWQTVLYDMLTSLDQNNPADGKGHCSRYLVISRSISEAEKHKEYLQSRGRRPLLIHSELSDAEKKNLHKFRNRQGDWDGLVCVAIGYIGLSVPDLSHMAYLTHFRSSAWFNQAIHRVTRMDNNPGAPPYERQFARIFCPKDPKMVELAQAIMDGQNPGVRDQKIPGRRPQPPRGEALEYTAIDASVSGREFNTNGEQCQENDFVDFIVRRIPALNQLHRTVVEEFKKETEGFNEEFKRETAVWRHAT